MSGHRDLSGRRCAVQPQAVHPDQQGRLLLRHPAYTADTLDYKRTQTAESSEDLQGRDLTPSEVFTAFCLLLSAICLLVVPAFSQDVPARGLRRRWRDEARYQWSDV